MTAEHIVHSVQNGHVRVVYDGFEQLLIEPDELRSHTPAPREIKVGDVVTWGGGANGYEVRGLHDGTAWLPSCYVDCVKRVSDLRHYEPA